MQRLFAFDNQEVLNEFAIGEHGLGANAGATAFDISGLDLRHEALKRGAEEFVAEGAADFIAGHRGVAAEKAPETRKGEGVPKVRDGDVVPTIAFAGEGQNGVGARLDAPMNETGEMDAEEGERRVGDGVDEMADKVLAAWLDHVIFAAEGDDPGFTAFAGKGGDAVTMQAGAVDEEVGFVLAVKTPARFDFRNGAVGADLGAVGGEEPDHRVTDMLVVDYAFFGDAEGEESGGVGFDLMDLFRLQEAEPGEAILLAAAVEVVEAGKLCGLGGDDEFAADFVADTVFLTEGYHLANAVDGESGLGGARFVVKTGVEDTGIIAGLVAADGGFLFKDGDAEMGQAMLKAEGGGEADDAAADDGDAGGRH